MSIFFRGKEVVGLGTFVLKDEEMGNSFMSAVTLSREKENDSTFIKIASFVLLGCFFTHP